MVILMKEKFMRGGCLMCLDYLLAGGEGGKGVEEEGCERFVEVLGLKGVFKAFMGKVCLLRISKLLGETR